VRSRVMVAWWSRVVAESSFRFEGEGGDEAGGTQPSERGTGICGWRVTGEVGGEFVLIVV